MGRKPIQAARFLRAFSDRLREPYGAPHSTAIPDPTEKLITILMASPRLQPGPAIGPAAPPPAGGEAPPEAEDGQVGWSWRGEISHPSFDPLFPENPSYSQNPASRKGLGKTL